MSFCIICFVRASVLHLSGQTSLGQQPTSAPDLTSELEDYRKFSLNSLMALLGTFTISGSSSVLQPVVLTLLIYTISLHFAANTCFFHNHLMLSRLFHVVPILGTFCLAGVALVSGLKSPALATVGLLLGIFPALVILVVHHGRRCAEIPLQALPMQMQDLSLSRSGVAGGTEAA